MNIKNRTLFIADNLDILRGINSGCIDLIYLDPPFNSKRNYKASIGSPAEGAEFKDIWTDEDIKYEWHGEIAEQNDALYQIIQASEIVYDKSMKIYLMAMTVRLFEMKRILRHTGSIYLHCDPTASHYLKMVMDSLFGKYNFLADITWKRYAAHNLSKSAVDTISDQLLYYAKDSAHITANTVASEVDTTELNERFPHLEVETGRRFQHVALEQRANESSAGEQRRIGDKMVMSEIGWRWSQSTFDKRLSENPHLIYWTRNGRPRYKIYDAEYLGKPIGNIWTDIPYLSAGDSERTGYPTQKPLALLERIIKASSNEGDVVLDPFCGCATACVAAEQLDRQWIGIDISPSTEDITKLRLDEASQQGSLLTDIQMSDVFVEKQPPVRTDLPKQPKPKHFKHELYGQQEGKCAGCHYFLPFRNMTIDHIVPKSKGGTDAKENLQLLCNACNSTKSTRSQTEFIEVLREQGIRTYVQ